jgi:hypothetical protein
MKRRRIVEDVLSLGANRYFLVQMYMISTYVIFLHIFWYSKKHLFSKTFFECVFQVVPPLWKTPILGIQAAKTTTNKKKEVIIGMQRKKAKE